MVNDFTVDAIAVDTRNVPGGSTSGVKREKKPAIAKKERGRERKEKHALIDF